LTTGESLGLLDRWSRGLAGTGATLLFVTPAVAQYKIANQPVSSIFSSAANAAPRAVNADTIRAALEGATIKTTQEAGVSIPAVERYVRMLEAGNPAPAIQVADGVIVNGNHRYVAGRIFGVEPPQVPGTLAPSQVPQIKPIQQIKLDPTDWGNH